LPAALIYAVIRQETLYRADAVSHAGALGLMQLTPDTARHTATRWRKPLPGPADLFEPDINIALGAAQLREMLDALGGQPLIAIAAYNAGPNAARRWLPAAPCEADVWLENIPYNETRSYVQRVLWHELVFTWLQNGEPQDTAAWLQPIRAVAGNPA
jgi:soluble lytic murein transglycosylase